MILSFHTFAFPIVISPYFLLWTQEIFSHHFYKDIFNFFFSLLFLEPIMHRLAHFILYYLVCCPVNSVFHITYSLCII